MMAEQQETERTETGQQTGGQDEATGSQPLQHGSGAEDEEYEYDQDTYALLDKERDEELPPECQIWNGLPAEFDLKALMKNIWRFMINYDTFYHKDNITAEWDSMWMIRMLQEGLEVLEKEPYVVDWRDMKEPVVIAGQMYAHIDSLTNQLSAAGLPPHKNIVFMGCYFGVGSAHVEQFLFALGLKTLFPSQVVLLRGHTDDEEQMHKLDIAYWLMERGISQTDGQLDEVLDLLKDCLSHLSVAALLPQNVVVMAGGPGPKLLEAGIKGLLELEKTDILGKDEAELIFEACWSILVPEEGDVTGQDDDGVPTYTEFMVQQFCEENDIELLIRGRQQVEDGLLRHPPCMLTLGGATNYGDILTNGGSWLTLDGRKMFVHRWFQAEMSFESLFASKYNNGRNSIARRFNWQE